MSDSGEIIPTGRWEEVAKFVYVIKESKFGANIIYIGTKKRSIEDLDFALESLYVAQGPLEKDRNYYFQQPVKEELDEN